MKLLVIDSARPFLEAVRHCAAELGGCSVTTAGSAATALRAARAIRPEIVLADCEVRTDDGRSVIHALRPLLPGALLVRLTLADEGGPARARWRERANFCMEKPRVAESLPALLAAAIH